MCFLFQSSTASSIVWAVSFACSIACCLFASFDAATLTTSSWDKDGEASELFLVKDVVDVCGFVYVVVVSYLCWVWDWVGVVVLLLLLVLVVVLLLLLLLLLLIALLEFDADGVVFDNVSLEILPVFKALLMLFCCWGGSLLAAVVTLLVYVAFASVLVTYLAPAATPSVIAAFPILVKDCE